MSHAVRRSPPRHGPPREPAGGRHVPSEHAPSRQPPPQHGSPVPPQGAQRSPAHARSLSQVALMQQTSPSAPQCAHVPSRQPLIPKHTSPRQHEAPVPPQPVMSQRELGAHERPPLQEPPQQASPTSSQSPASGEGATNASISGATYASGSSMGPVSVPGMTNASGGGPASMPVEGGASELRSIRQPASASAHDRANEKEAREPRRTDRE